MFNRLTGILSMIVFALLVSACGAQTATPTAAPAPTAAAAAPTLQGKTWQWVSYNGPTEVIVTISTTPDYTLTFNADGSLAIKADCNQAVGTYEAADGALRITLGPVTAAACGENSHSEKLLKLLPSAALYRFDGNDLVIELMADGGTLDFVPLP
ncbi:META domain-containing protein [Candidatus Chloroploca sp. Khr17]|uniref:META domain-containing protein n=1 Tax=Candidatus Chloroploca sp. Khr17 TaxID=2496869 RepID=UPI00101BC797|nr:META domain-containing protein [Candidatus Chloroploca sp. Khr17]